MKPCLNCQKDYEPKKDASKFCSTKCRVAYHRKHPKKAAVSQVQVQVLYNAVLEMIGTLGKYGSAAPIAPKTPYYASLAQPVTPAVSQDAIMRKYVEDKRDCTCQEEYVAWEKALEADTRISSKQKQLVKSTH